MKKMILLMMLCSSFAFANKTLVHSIELHGQTKSSFAVGGNYLETYDWDGDYQIRYEADERSGRAWIEASLSYEFVEDYYSKEFKFQIPGLKLVGDNVIYQNHGINKVCGSLGKGFLTKRRIVKQKYRSKAACRIKMELREKTVDTGFDYKDVYVADFYMVTK